MAGSFFDRHFVRWSSPESIEAEKISLLAVAEVIFSVAAYWWIAWYFDTYAHLLISVIVAPLVLLRSDESVALGVEMFSQYWRTDIVFPRRPAKRSSVVILSALSVGGVGWLIAEWLLTGHETWTLFSRAEFIGLFVALFVVALPVAITGLEMGTVAIALVVGIPVAYTVALIVAEKGTSAGLGEVAIAGLCGIGFGVFVRAFWTRLSASFRYIYRGASAFPDNWRQTLFQIDLLSAPEVVPGIGKKHPELSLWRMVEEWRSETIPYMRSVSALLIAIFFIPSLLYRYSLKSTCWLYLPLIYVAHLPGRLRDGEGRLIWVRALPSKFIEWIRFWLAGLTLGIAFFALINAAALHALLTAAGAGETPVTIFSLFLVLDFAKMHPWQYFTLPSAALTIFLVLWLDSIRKDEAAGATIDALGWKINTAIYADRVRSLLVYIWLGLALYYFAEYAYGRCLLDDWMASWLQWRFGPLACPAPGN